MSQTESPIELICRNNGMVMDAPWTIKLIEDLEAYRDKAVKEARLTDNHDWDTESFKRQDVIVCTRCATTYQTRGNKPCKGKMAKITLREANNTGDEV